ncbi:MULTISPECIES: response regulator transcription factor [Campylobacter]|uniref:response regulator transcription factor n=1 Tax=Campylobacter TaxID=194 RepID=UPI001474793F|nr:response regulator transcription factor [Campylobacter sp. RM12916]MBE3022784.1 response regulator transcription factor [Campylobacter sp. 7477a]MBE3610409.1 response regulator transcription factor [Campylobacter sp. RM12916]
MNEHIVVVDDELDLCELLEFNLQKAGYNVTTFSNTKRVEQFLDEEKVDLVIMDRNLPGIEGGEFIKILRQKGYNEPVIFLSAKGSKDEKLQGFENGGDDYITKPFELDDLLVRIKAVLRRSGGESEFYKFKEIVVKKGTGEVFVGEKALNLTKLETELLIEFIKNKFNILSRDHLLQSVWQDDTNSDKSVNIAVKRLRQKLGKSGDHIVSVRGEGYKIC